MKSDDAIAKKSINIKISFRFMLVLSRFVFFLNGGTGSNFSNAGLNSIFNSVFFGLFMNFTQREII